MSFDGIRKSANPQQDSGQSVPERRPEANRRTRFSASPKPSSGAARRPVIQSTLVTGEGKALPEPVRQRSGKRFVKLKSFTTEKGRTLLGSVGAALRGRRYRMAVVAVFLFLVLAFAGGMWYARSTSVTEADSELMTTETAPLFYYAPIAENGGASTTVPISLSNQLLFNTPIVILEKYLGGRNELTEDELAGLREDKLRAYLKERKSPFVTEAAAIARQKHWKLILAISFAESNMGKKCKYNNCSGIGGSTNFKHYDSVRDWIVDLNNLLENRYSEWTLEEMNGVYVQPKNDNWLLATRKILSELQERKIE